ncbi:hypothetical protein PA598K_05172 [Paenibacillus sp. 598K]|uniref:hypothetical protein n=1 Tax=Paenibacillus sp. 598K TaxID=1117987 RepID=UPI000FFB039C|nr:hypothetical protein [Paenibacillus sp. 598K]GBF76687.1 hypothetical protein PA598K_05172 [Paenibacillus sp. 598K]
MDSVQRTVWDAWTTEEKQAHLQELSLPAGFSLLRMDRFARYGRQLETGVFAYQDSEFVFIPGDRVTLGWEGGTDRMDTRTRVDLEEGLETLGMTLADAPTLLRQQMSPVREVTIGSMLVERLTRSASWEEATPEELEEDEELQADLTKFLASTYKAYERHETHRFNRTGDGVRVELFWTSDDYPDWAEANLEEGFAILTEDEWEYIYGCGSRTLFPWGDSFDYTMKVRHLGELDRSGSDANEMNGDAGGDEGAADGTGMSGDSDRGHGRPGESERPYDLELPGAFGLHFHGDPYQWELTVSADGIVRVKGGDGGNALCGGMGVLFGYLPTATSYRDPYAEELDWSEQLGHMHYRRILRL